MFPLQHVQPGDLITAELINSILDQLGALGAQPGQLSLVLGPLAEKTHTLVALGTGFESGGGIWLDGVSLLAGSPARGINLVILDANLNVKFRGTYDTHGDANSSARFASDIQSATQQHDIVAVVTHDAYVAQLQPNAKAALASVGGAALATPASNTRAGAAFIGVVPANKASAQFNYLVSVIPADSPGFGSQRIAGLPFAWGVYSLTLQRFLVGGTSGQLGVGATSPTQPTVPTITVTFPTTFPTPTVTFPTTFPTLTVTFPTTFPTATIPTFTITLPTDFPTATFPTFPTIFPTLFGIVQPENEVTALPGLGSMEQEQLSSAGIATVRDLADATPDKVADVLGISNEAAARFIGTARTSLGG